MRIAGSEPREGLSVVDLILVDQNCYTSTSLWRWMQSHFCGGGQRWWSGRKRSLTPILFLTKT